MPALPNVAAVLADHGVRPRACGYAWADLARLAEARRWQIRVEAASRPHGPAVHRAVVWFRPDTSPHRILMTQVARGRGATEEAALAQALAVALARDPNAGVPIGPRAGGGRDQERGNMVG
ncbi:MAG: hypothetical protein AVDCRST_MAG73-1753 [uncultured Thermomicrobiales bacterium]|uniref:Uncharacterized protein n=1 Tax=uncultured Thermomicrobiales bacterium TaxID=1645740 RepID=A0A6J4U2X8_9BACT|nr:MAG: hypothetical protein AVDCRST_MAG73-1753 [uncultured Thermomicrobiales bacterium]